MTSKFLLSLFLCSQFGCSDSKKKSSKTEGSIKDTSVAVSTTTETAKMVMGEMWPDSISATLTSGVEKSLNKMNSMKPGDSAWVQYWECILADGRPATFCIKAPFETWLGTTVRDPDFSWNVIGTEGWAHNEDLTYQTLNQGIWQSNCEAVFGQDGYVMWIENGTPGNNKHKGGSPWFKDRNGNVWMIGEDIFYRKDGGHLSTFIIIKGK